MAQNKRQTRLLGLVEDSDADEISSDSLVSFAPDENSNMPNATVTKRTRGRPPANKITKPTTKAPRRVGGKGKGKETGVQEALVEKSVNEGAVKPRRGRKPKQQDDVTMADVVEDSTNASTKQTGVRGRGRHTRATTAGISALTPRANNPPQDAQAASNAALADVSEMAEAASAAVVVAGQRENEVIGDSPDPKNSAPMSVRFPSCSPKKRPSDPADPEASAAQLRRRIGDLNKKCEGLETKYRDLREIGVKEAERNFDRLRKQSDERTKAANVLIQELRDALNAQRALAEEGQQHRQQLEIAGGEMSKLKTSLAEARKEIGTLNAKLAASRSAEVATAGIKVPGSAIKGQNATAKAAVGGNTEAVQTAQMKEDLYGDLTGLIVRGIKREMDGDVYDCIQTGRNGTLHFKLVIENETSSDSYEEAQFTYSPQLDENRDRGMIDVLPDYLRDEITFPRPHAAKFFSRITRSLMERLD